MTESTASQQKNAKLFQPGDVLAQRYRLTRPLGAGGYSTVFAATDLTTQQEIAVKILKTGGGNNDPSALPRLRQEANLLQSIDHPNILKIYNFEQYQDLAYVTMENVPGISLAHIIYREGPAESERVLPIVKQLLSALHATHVQRILHRDIKPENILISPGPPETCKIVDFGLAKAYMEEDLEPNNLQVTLVKTKAGGFLGTPRYTPPEQALGDPIGPYTDLFSLGLVIAEWLTGEVRLKGDTHAELMRNLVGPTPVDVSDCPRAWQKWLSMILCKDPTQRFRDAQQALTSLIDEVEAELFGRRAEDLAMDIPDGFFQSSNTGSFLDEDGPLELDLERVEQTRPAPPAVHPGFGPPHVQQGPPHHSAPPHFAQMPPQQGAFRTRMSDPLNQTISTAPGFAPLHDDYEEPEETPLSNSILVAIIGGSLTIICIIVIAFVLF